MSPNRDLLIWDVFQRGFSEWNSVSSAGLFLVRVTPMQVVRLLQFADRPKARDAARVSRVPGFV